MPQPFKNIDNKESEWAQLKAINENFFNQDIIKQLGCDFFSFEGKWTFWLLSYNPQAKKSHLYKETSGMTFDCERVKGHTGGQLSKYKGM